MTDSDLDRAYTALSETLAEVGERNAPLFLSMLSLSLLSRFGRAEEVLPLIDNAGRQCVATKAADAA
jgi:hypothetical protein